MPANVEVIVMPDEHKDEYWGPFTIFRNTQIAAESVFQPEGSIIEVCGNGHDPKLIEFLTKACEDYIASKSKG